MRRRPREAAVAGDYFRRWLAPEIAALVKQIEARGGKSVKTAHFATDHSYSDHRIALESGVLQWLASLK